MVDQLDQAAQAAWLYYERGLNQEEIARRLAISRSTVSRLLTLARTCGIVEITVTRPLPHVSSLEAALLERFPLQLAMVEPLTGGDDAASAAALAGARFLSRRVRSLSVVGVGWGATIAAVARLVPVTPVPTVTLVDVVGRPQGEEPLVAVSRVLGRAWSAEVLTVPAPAFAASPELYAQLSNNPVVELALARARAADLIVLSIGSTGADSTLARQGIVPKNILNQLQAKGAVGDILGHFYDCEGNQLTVPGLPLPVGLSLSDLQGARLVLAVVTGASKVAATAAAARAGLVSALITEEETAQQLLDS